YRTSNFRSWSMCLVGDSECASGYGLIPTPDCQLCGQLTAGLHHRNRGTHREGVSLRNGDASLARMGLPPAASVRGPTTSRRQQRRVSVTTMKVYASVVLVVFALLTLPQSVHAKPIKVGDGSPLSCTDAALRHALTLAGEKSKSVIQFACGVEPTTITVI